MTRRSTDPEHPAAPTPAEEVVEAIHTLMHGFRSRQFRVLREAGHDLGHMEAKALGFFARHPGATQRDLSLRSGRDKGQVARLIAGLRERGLLDAQPDEADRRSVRLAVSDAGQALQAAWDAQSRALADEATRGLSADEQQTLLALLARMRANLGDD